MDPAVQGALVGGGFALVATLANFTYNWIQKNSERQFGMRQQVYLEACGAAARGTEYLASFARLDLDDAQLGQIFYSATSAYYKVHVVANLETVLAFIAAIEYLGTQAVTLGVTRLELRQQIERLKALQTEAQQASSYVNQVASNINNMPKATPSQEILSLIPQVVGEFTAARERLLNAQGEIRKVQSEIVRLQEQLLWASLRAANGYEDHLVNANVAARRELGMELNAGEYRQSVNKASQAVVKALERVIEKYKNPPHQS